MSNGKKLAILSATFIVIVIVGSIIIKAFLDSRATLQLSIAPRDAEILLDGTRVNPGSHSVSSGSHTIKISMDGFNTHETTMEITSGETRDFRFALEPNSPNTANWYRDHPEDATVADGVASQQYLERGSQISRDYPIITILPTTERNAGFKVNYGAIAGIADFYLDISVFIYPDDPETALDANTQLTDTQKTQAQQPFLEWLENYRNTSGDTTEYIARYNYVYY